MKKVRDVGANAVRGMTRREALTVVLIEECDGAITVKDENSKSYSDFPIMIAATLLGFTLTNF